ncbi:MAG TPA: carbohydrate ABC transporter permease [Methylomirabilota bacterium]|nr:carbohydrate ABC transporter permease [Methylomirabilota bacterium]
MRGINDPAPGWAALSHAALGFWAFVVLFPLYWLAVTSLKLPIQVNDGPDYLPGIDFEPSLHAWRYIFVDLFVDTMRPYMNTVVVALCSSVLALVFGSMAAYGLSRLSYRPRLASIASFIVGVAAVVVATAQFGVPWTVALAIGLAVFVLLALGLRRHITRRLKNEDIAFWMISQRMLPPVAVVLPIYLMFQQVGRIDSDIGLDTRFALTVTYVAANIPIVVWLMRDFFDTIPLELEEAALVDGCSRYRIFWSIVLPLAKPGLAATFILVLIMAWNEYLFALFLSSANAQTLPLTVAAQNATRGPQWWYMSVLIIIMILPVSALALLLSRYITRGLLIGAVKG